MTIYINNKPIIFELANATPEEFGMKSIPINQLKKKKETYFQIRLGSSVIYKINHYDRPSKSYSISPVENINKESFIKSNRQVFISTTNFDY